jgi:ABC-type branched-subunit amino acid transport system permease subunit
MNQRRTLPEWAGRAIACFVGAVVLALMVGPQQGSRDDYGLTFRHQVLNIRIIWFLLLGAAVFLAITYREIVSRYARRPGVRPLIVGVLILLASYFLMRWYDPLGNNGKFAGLAAAVSDTQGLAPLAKVFFGWLWWVSLLVLIVGIFVAIARRIRWLGWASAGFAVLMGVLALVAHSAAVGAGSGIDHSFGAQTAFVGYLTLAGAGVTAARSQAETAATREFIERVMAFRPGLPLVVMGLVLGVLALTIATWFAPQQDNRTLVDTSSLFSGSAASGLSAAYLGWLGYVLFVVVLLIGAAAVWTGQRWIGYLAAGVAAVAILLTVITLHDISTVAFHAGRSDGPWRGLGTGGWLLAIALFSIGAGGFVAARRAPVKAESQQAGGYVDTDADSRIAGRLHQMGASTTTLSIALFGVGLALFYPPTATSFWQQALVTDIGVYVMLAVGLNVVIGWAGLLDLGYIAFYAIGSYTTAYVTGSLPVKPPHWLLLSPLWAIPLAVGICLLAGVVLGAPTLRLRGDYLAIVTLGFGEIIRIIAVNNPVNFTNGPRGVASAVPHPVVNLGFFRIEWGGNQLQYWYLLLVFVGILVVLFYRLEGSRLGRAWAAVREDEVAAQASGVNTTRVKLLAFAIGASTSGLAGVFFASDIGYFNPQNFILNNSILIVAYVVFGGMGSLTGAIAGAAVLTWLPDFLRDQVPSEDRVMWIGAVLIIMMIFRPEGLIPAKRRRAELSGLVGHDTAVRQSLQAVPAGEGV